MIGQVYKIHSDFYYVKPESQDNAGGALLECKLREVIKKQRQIVRVGDFVEVDDGVAICKVLKRKNTLMRPSVANLDTVLVVASLVEPKLDFTQLNRYLSFLKYHKIDVLLCFNKDDLMDADELAITKQKIESIYMPLGYKTIFTSALNKDGIADLKESLKDKTIAFCGQSGVGKSSILNAINPNFSLKIGAVSEKHGRGTHTTRHCEILEFDEFKIIDTPGFSRLTFDFLHPRDLGTLFDEISALKDECKYSDCLHTLGTGGCNVIKHIENIDITRYDSYLEFLKETKEYKEKVTYSGVKIESSSKLKNGQNIAKISSKKRVISRKKARQAIGIEPQNIEEESE